jgi:hypothetical protein
VGQPAESDLPTRRQLLAGLGAGSTVLLWTGARAASAQTEGGPGKFSQSIGDGTATSFVVAHNLNSADVVIEVFAVDGGATVIPNTARIDANTIRLEFGNPPATDEYRVVVIG